MEEQVVLVNTKDEPQGLMEKMEAHEKGVLHRAFSIFIFNNKNELLLQQRALSKYHTPGLWTNTCCSHPRENESLEAATSRRLKEEMGMQCEINHAFSFIYKADVGQGLTEHEFDHVFIGHSDELPVINPGEVASWRYATMSEISADIANHPEKYTAWFRIAFDEVDAHLKNLKTK
ncbi:MAG TPA: isopentenyl-diphosphate Delta-isomerase [Bacteroidales bacterium]|jgi:isopentenyl-diphosphate delta-isomerase|nr:isopentenyl-diphosphate Delta-isomerase [Bacteroidales bacterium]MDD4085850.1 isopentenyl-diphosphate Delta-isomerase [Bacteroidales bacterium]MDY0085427.1 isopentenyl-diphosphate Delta-isomerase [Bacteroidales bacterium]HPE43430.1 isopentenyl-diphosphate Delta-isomerase [Bacteroidales bacterium]